MAILMEEALYQPEEALYQPEEALPQSRYMDIWCGYIQRFPEPDSIQDPHPGLPHPPIGSSQIGMQYATVEVLRGKLGKIVSRMNRTGFEMVGIDFGGAKLYWTFHNTVKPYKVPKRETFSLFGDTKPHTRTPRPISDPALGGELQTITWIRFVGGSILNPKWTGIFEWLDKAESVSLYSEDIKLINETHNFRIERHCNQEVAIEAIIYRDGKNGYVGLRSVQVEQTVFESSRVKESA